jgi:hypothetical protein
MINKKEPIDSLEIWLCEADKPRPHFPLLNGQKIFSIRLIGKAGEPAGKINNLFFGYLGSSHFNLAFMSA